MKTAHAVITRTVRTVLSLLLAMVSLGYIVAPARADAPVATETQPPAATVFQNVCIFECARSRQPDRADLLDADPDRPARRHHGDRRRRAHSHARSHRCPLARDACASNTRGLVGGRRRLHEPGRGCRGEGHAVAGIYHRSRRGWTGVWPEAGYRRGCHTWAAYLPLGRCDYGYRWSWRLPSVVRIATQPRWAVDTYGDARCEHGGRQSGRGTRACARTADAGRIADQVDGRRRRRLAPQSARRIDLHRAGTTRCRGSCRELGNVRHRARLYAGCNQAGNRRWREVHRARPAHGRIHRQAYGGARHLA